MPTRASAHLLARVKIFAPLLALAASSGAGAQQPERVALGTGVEARGELHVLGDRLLFVGAYKGQGALVATDGTTAGTTLLERNLDITLYEIPGAVTVIGTHAYFNADRAPYGTEPWVSDGTAAGTLMLGDINPGDQISHAGQFVAYRGAVYFTADDGVHGAELWVTDGTPAGTHLAVDVVPGAQGSGPLGLTVYGDALFFYASGTDEGGWWRSDGTPTGTVRTGDVPAGWALAPILVPFRDRVYFYAQFKQYYIWTTDGTTAGTYLLSDATLTAFDPGFTVCNGALYFGAIVDGPDGPELFRSDGTVGGTHAVAPALAEQISCIGTHVYYWSQIGGWNVWRSDGTAAGTVQMTRFEGVIPEYRYQNFFTFDKTVYFGAAQLSAPNTGYELWRLDGSPAGARLVEDLNAGPADASPAYFVTYRGAFYFIASDADGRFLWRIRAASNEARRRGL